MKRSRGRSRKTNNQVNRQMDSNGPDVKIRGTATHIYEKYLGLARDAGSAGDRVKAENYLQHAEHYFRILRAANGTVPKDDLAGEDTARAGSGHEGADRSRSDDRGDGGKGDETASAVAQNDASDGTARNSQDSDAGSAKPARRRRGRRTDKSANGDQAVAKGDKDKDALANGGGDEVEASQAAVEPVEAAASDDAANAKAVA